MKGVDFDSLDLDNKHQITVITQEIEAIVPKLVSENDRIKLVTYENFLLR